jgi:hypothetical protein
MAQTGYTPLLIYASGTASNVPSAANLTSSASGAELALNYADGKLYFKNSSGVVTLLASSAGASGDVVGPASATDNALARFDTTTGKLIQNSIGILSDAGVLTGLTGLTSSGNITLSALTSGRVPYASTGGLLVDSANLLFDGTTLTANALTTTSTVTINGGTANGVAYLNGSKVLTTGSALTFDGTNFQVGGNSQPIIRAVSSSTNNATARLFTDGDTVYVGSANTSTTGGSVPVVFQIGGSEQMRLTSTGLGIGVSSPGQKLSVSDSAGLISNFNSTNASGVYIRFQNSGTSIGDIGSGAQIVGGSAGDFGLTSRAGSLIFGQNSAEGMRLTSTGLGIGTSSPAYKLQVGDGSADTRALFLSNNNFSMGVGRSTGTIGKWLGSPSSNVLTFSGNDGTEQMRLDSSGNLGIGTNTIPTVGSTTVLAVGNSSGGTLGIVQSGSIAYRISASTSGVDCFNPNSSPISWYTNGTERMRLDASGNLGIGTSSPAYKLDVSGSAFASNWYGPQTAFTVGTVGGGVGLIGYGSTGVGGLTNTLLFQANGEKMRLDSSGNLGIGTTSPSYQLTVGTAGTTADSYIQIASTTTGTGNLFFGDTAGTGAGSFRGYIQYNHNVDAMLFASAGSERARIDSSGRLIVGSTSSNGDGSVEGVARSNSTPGVVAGSRTSGDIGSAALLVTKFDNDSTTSQVFQRFSINNNGTASGQINANGANAAAFGSWSDARLKENIVDLPPQLANVMALRPVEFDYIESEGGGHQTGFIAQEMESIYPDAVGERHDGMKTITGWSKTEARLVKAIQELKADLDATKAELAALKGA